MSVLVRGLEIAVGVALVVAYVLITYWVVM